MVAMGSKGQRVYKVTFANSCYETINQLWMNQESTYRVFQRRTWYFELWLWLGFLIIALLIRLGVVLSSGNSCLINHFNLFWPQTASAASDKKCQNSKLFLLICYPNLDRKWAQTTLNFDTFYLRLLRLSEVKKVSNGWSGINFLYSGPHQA